MTFRQGITESGCTLPASITRTRDASPIVKQVFEDYAEFARVLKAAFYGIGIYYCISYDVFSWLPSVVSTLSIGVIALVVSLSYGLLQPLKSADGKRLYEGTLNRRCINYVRKER